MYKLTQFADDTTLILDGSVSSLQAALNTLEIFGNFSGLQMNRAKNESYKDWQEKTLNR